MHLADQLLSARVYVPAAAAAVVGLSFCASRIGRGRADSPLPAPTLRGRTVMDQVPLMGVLGAFVFAAQMVNFPVLPGTSGHLGGGVLLAILFGPFHASILMASILMVQCLIFQDGGILALGANIINMGIVPCFVGYACYRILASGRFPGRRAAAFCAAFAGVLGGACLVPFEVCCSGVVGIPFGGFLAVMAGVHVLIGAAEGVITVVVLKAIDGLSPARTAAFAEGAGGRGLSRPALTAVIFVVALLVGGGLSIFASDDPDGLEKAVEISGFSPERAIGAEPIPAPMADYRLPGLTGTLSVALAGLIGTVVTFLVIFLLTRFAGRTR
jgi:cobalt/nickel transport system permease protein